MSIFWNKRVRSISPYVPGEQPRDRKFIKLNTNENPYPPSPMVIDAIKGAAAETLRLYPDPACTDFREAVAARYGISSDQVFAGNGSDEVLAFAFAAFFENNPVLFPDITYSFYPVYADLWNVPYKTIPLREDFSINVQDYIEGISVEKSGGIVFPNPNAPTGMAIPMEDIKKIAGTAGQSRQVLIVDEAYISFADEEGVGSALPLLKEFPNVILVRTLSKEASLAGLRAGFAIGSRELMEGLCRIRDCFNSYVLDRLALAGAAAAIRDAEYYNEINRRVIATRRRVSAGLEALGFKVLPSQSNFLFASPPEECGKNGREFFITLRELGILVRHFNKPRIANFMRISIGTDDEMNTFLEACSGIIRNENE